MKTLEVTAISDIRKQTNRQNSLSSTGPVTVAGKQKSRWNAVKHGLLVRDVAVSVGDSPESKKDLTVLHTALRADFNPVGTIEEMLVERIAVSYWRLSRCVRAESGEIAIESAGKSHEYYRNMSDEVESIEDRVYLERTFSSYRKSSFGLMHVIRHLERLREDVECKEDLDDKEFEKLLTLYGRKEQSLGFRLKMMSLIMKEHESKQTHESKSRKRRTKGLVKIMLETIDAEIKRCKDCLDEVSEVENTRLEASLKTAAVPPIQCIEKLLRYESAIERQLYKALDQLERLQRQRKGDYVPPPVQLGVSLES